MQRRHKVTDGEFFRGIQAILSDKKYVLFNCRWPIKFAIKIRAFLKKWHGIYLRRNFAILRSFFEREEQYLEI
jgi:hypothetical protein